MFEKKTGYLIYLLVGSFIFFSIVAVVAAANFGIFRIPEKTIKIKFDQVGPLPDDSMSVYYQGMEVGKTTKIELSEDYKSTFITVKIYKKDFNPPKNIYAQIRTEGQARLQRGKLILNKYVELFYPEKPSSEKLEDGDIIEGRLTALEKVQSVVEETVEKKDIKESIEDAQKALVNAEEISKNILEITKKINTFLDKNEAKMNKIVDDTAITVENARISTAGVRTFTDENLPGISEGINVIISEIDEVTGDKDFREKLLATPGDIQKLIVSADETIKNLDQKICFTLDDADRAINRYDCIGVGLSDLLSQRFLIPRLFFGRPGEAFQRCTGPCPPCYQPFNCCPNSPVSQY